MTVLSFVRRAGARLVGVGALAALVAAAACSEELDGGAGCNIDGRNPDLCPLANATVRDTTFAAVVLDTALAGVPVAGDAAVRQLAVRPGVDSLDVRAVVRFDSLPARFSPPAGGDSVPITAVAGTNLRLSLDTTGTRFAAPVTIEAYDVDTIAAADTVPAVLTSLFRPDRLLGRVTLATQTVAGDTVNVPLSDAAFAAKAQARARLRVGLRVVGTGTARVRFFGVGFGGSTGALAPRVSFDPATDTTVRPVQVTSASTTPAAPELAAAYRDQTVVARAPTAASGSDLVVGGLPARRTYLRFEVPSRFVDSVDVVRATLILTQRPAPGTDAIDTSVTIRALAVLATAAVTDLVRASDIATSAVGLDTVRAVPAGDAQKEFPVVNLVRAWRAIPATTPRALVLRSALEGAQAAEVRFYSIEAPAALRPRLRLSYIPRTSFGLP